METLAIVLSAMFITQYSLIYLYAPAPQDNRTGFEVLLRSTDVTSPINEDVSL